MQTLTTSHPDTVGSDKEQTLIVGPNGTAELVMPGATTTWQVVTNAVLDVEAGINGISSEFWELIGSQKGGES